MDILNQFFMALISLFTPPLSKILILVNRLISKLSYFSKTPSIKNPLMNIPGPRAFPIFGSSWQYSDWWFGMYKMEKYHESNEDKYARYGPVVRENVLWNFPLIHLFEKEEIEKVLNSKSKYPLRPPNEADVYYRNSRPELYNNIGMVNLNGPSWHTLRSTLTKPLTKSSTITNYVAHMNLIADDLTSLIKRRQNEQGIIKDFQDIVYRAGLETVCTVALERRMGFLADTIALDTARILNAIQGYQSSSNESMYGLPWWKYVPETFSGVFTSLVKHKDYLFGTFGAMIDENLVQNKDFCDEESIIHQLVSGNVDIKDVKASVVDYITAGVDTIGNTVIFALLLLAKYPEKQKKLQAEIERVLGSENYITKENIQEMKYLKGCVNESFRLYPTASQIARILDEEIITSNGHSLPPGSVVLCHQRIASLQEQNFTRAKEFIPERWLESEAVTEFGTTNYAHNKSLVMPFGFGKRICPGKKLAEQEIYIMTAKLMKNFNLRLHDASDFDVEFRFLLMPSLDNLQIQATSRDLS
ncbi:ecdysone 20-monooxygenase [Lepeophtheirus salmonis]|nr:ecdysone 20-monooxygenase-like [Lepeophtheirus salmonis]